MISQYREIGHIANQFIIDPEKMFPVLHAVSPADQITTIDNKEGILIDNPVYYSLVKIMTCPGISQYSKMEGYTTLGKSGEASLSPVRTIVQDIIGISCTRFQAGDY